MNKHTPEQIENYGFVPLSECSLVFGEHMLSLEIRPPAGCKVGLQAGLLIEEAGNVAIETGYGPRQLADKVKALEVMKAELFVALRDVVRCYCIPSGPHCGNIVTGAMRSAASEHAIAILAKCGKVGG